MVKANTTSTPTCTANVGDGGNFRGAEEYVGGARCGARRAHDFGWDGAKLGWGASADVAGRKRHLEERGAW